MFSYLSLKSYFAIKFHETLALKVVAKNISLFHCIFCFS